jgi:Zn-dependent protease with chaperone function
MTFLLQGATLTLAWFFAANVALSLFVVTVCARVSRRAPTPMWFGLRVLPALAAAVFAVAVFLPSYWRYEPRDTTEGFDVTLTAFAVAGAWLLGAGAFRAVRAERQARRLIRLWMERARPLAFKDGVTAFAIDSDRPIVALAGIVRPRLFVAQTVIDTLTADELRAGIAHEVAHYRAWDNLKRLLMCAAPDLLAFTRTARVLERRWAAAAEHAADGMCGDIRPSARWALASALVKVARLTPPVTPEIAPPISTLIDDSDIASRVERLLDDDALIIASRSSRRTAAALAIAFAALALTYTPLLVSVHEVTEVLVHVLP